MCGNAGEQRPGVVAAQQAPRRGALRQHPQARRAPPSAGPAGATACRRATGRRTPSSWSASGPSSRRHDAPSSSSAQVRVEVAVGDRRRPVRAADWRRRSPAPPTARRARAGRTRRRTATPAPAGAPPSRCRGARRGTRGRAAVRAPPPAVGWASTTRTDKPGPGADDGSGQPVGPAADDGDVHAVILPPASADCSPLRCPREPACCIDRRQTRRIDRRRPGRPGRGALGRRPRPGEAAGRGARGRRAAGALGHHRGRRGAGRRRPS